MICFSLAGSSTCVDILVGHFGSHIVELPDSSGSTPIHLAALSDNSECLNVLLNSILESKSINNASTNTDCLSLSDSSYKLISEVAHLDFLDHQKHSPLHCAAQQASSTTLGK